VSQLYGDQQSSQDASPTIRAVLTHKPEREELNLKPRSDPKPDEDCQTEPQTSTGDAEEGDGSFDAIAMVTRVDTDEDLERHDCPCSMKET
jgi:hypothetical protein